MQYVCKLVLITRKFDVLNMVAESSLNAAGCSIVYKYVHTYIHILVV